MAKFWIIVSSSVTRLPPLENILDFDFWTFNSIRDWSWFYPTFWLLTYKNISIKIHFLSRASSTAIVLVSIGDCSIYDFEKCHPPSNCSVRSKNVIMFSTLLNVFIAINILMQMHGFHEKSYFWSRPSGNVIFSQEDATRPKTLQSAILNSFITSL